jgi:hypothetical protein
VFWITLIVQMLLGGQLEAWTVCYTDALQLDRWDIEIVLHEQDTVDFTAATEVDLDYYEATIEYNLPRLAAEDEVYLRRTVVHELLHIHTWELGLMAEDVDYDKALSLQEQLGTRLDRLPIWLTVCQTPGGP